VQNEEIFDSDDISEKELNEIRYGHKLKFWQTYSLDHPTDRLTYPFRKWFVRNDFRFRIVKWLAWMLRRAWVTLPEIDSQHRNSLALLHSTDSDYSIDSKFGDTAITGELQTWAGYRAGALSGKFGGESPILYKHVISKSTELLKSNSLKTFFNLGVSYPYIDSELANQFPNIKFLGIERTEVIPLLNNHFFENQKNMESISGDLFDFLKKNALPDSLFFHARTMTLLSRTFVERAYAAAADAGCNFIFGNEQIGVSRMSGQSFQFSFNDKPSEIYRKRMFMHNYPAILKRAGYKLIYIEALKTGHPDPDYRILSFVGKRIEAC